MKNLDTRVHTITPLGFYAKNSQLRLLEEAIEGGTTVVQYRDKRDKERYSKSMLRNAERIHKVTIRYGIPLIINDHVEIALAIGAEGVHVGQDDMPATIARNRIGPNRILGVSIRTPEEALEALKARPDYLGVGPIYPSKTKPDEEAIGLEPLKKIARVIGDTPMVVIGGITAENARKTIEYGDGKVKGIAVVGAADWENGNVKIAIRSLREIVDNTLLEINIKGKEGSLRLAWKEDNAT